MPQINAYDAAPGRTVEVVAGDLFEEALKVDLLVISAWEGFYEPEPGSMVAVLEKRCGLVVQELQQAPELDLRGASTIRAWITPELDTLTTPPQWPAGSSTRFRRLAVVEGPRNAPVETTEQVVFQQLFCLLSLLPLHGIACRSVATPLLNTGRQQADPEQLYPAMLNAIANGFRHLPELRQLVIFDLKEDSLKSLCDRIDIRLNRTPLELDPLEFKPHQRQQLASLLSTIKRFRQTWAPLVESNNDVHDQLAIIHKQISDAIVVPVTLGIAARTLLETLVGEALILKGLTVSLIPSGLYERVKCLNLHLDPWMDADLTTIRCFGNWMAHATPLAVDQQIPRRAVTFNDLLSMLLALERMLCQYPWPNRVTRADLYRRVNRLRRDKERKSLR
jgi:hypothetical protein